MIAYICVGNTNVKCSLVKNQKIETVFIKINEDYLVVIEQFLKKNLVKQVVYLSVVKEVDLALLKKIEILGLILKNISDYHFDLDFNGYHTIGIDRKVACYAVLSNKPSIVIDLGTATTVNVINDNIYLGGIIMPGVMLGLNALTMKTAAINEDAIFKPDNLLSLDTNGNISAGLIYQTSFALNEIVDRIYKKYNFNFEVYLTGGNAQYIIDYLNFQFEYRSDLVIEGMIKCTNK